MRDKRHWDEFCNSLSKELVADNIEVLPFDTLGNGDNNQLESPLCITDYAKALLLQLPASNYCIIGLSMGGMIALEMARLAPSMVAKVVVINASASNLSPWYLRFNLIALLNAYWCRTKAEDVHWLEATALYISSEQHCNSEVLAKRWSQFRVEGRVSLRNALRQLWACARYRCSHSLQQPVFVFSGRLDQLVAPSCSKAMAKHYHCRLIEFEQAGHDISIDVSAALTAQLKKALLR